MMRFMLLFCLCLLVGQPAMATPPGKIHVMKAHNAGLNLDKATYRSIKKTFSESFKKKQVPAGWRQLSGGQIKALVSGKSMRSHYLNSRQIFDYAFYRNGYARRRRLGDGDHSKGKWFVKGGHLHAFNLDFTVYTNGKYYLMTRVWRGRIYGETYLPGKRFSFGYNDKYIDK